MAAYTEHYHLHQWEPEDNFLRTDFNEDFRVLDKALALKPEILSGSYTGDDARSRDISLGVSPRAVFVVRQDGAMQSDMYTYGGLALQGAPVTMRDGNLVEITSSGIRVARGDLIEGRFYADANRSGMRAALFVISRLQLDYHFTVRVYTSLVVELQSPSLSMVITFWPDWLISIAR